MSLFDVLIIGNGPGGCSAAVYAGNAGMNVAILSGNHPGGQLTKTHIVTNYLGFSEISGYDLANKFIEHASKHSKIINEHVVKIEALTDRIKVFTDTNVYQSKFLIVASGSSHKKIPIKSILDLENKGVSYCYICDGFFYRNRTVVVVGGGNSAFEAVIYLATLCKQVYLVHRSENFKAFKENQQQVQALVKSGKVKLVLNSEVIDAKTNAGEELSFLSIRNVENGKVTEVATDGLFIHIGSIPQTSFLNGIVQLDEHGYVIVNRNQQTSNKRIFAAGDCCVFNDSYEKFKQAGAAAFEGTQAALLISRLINQSRI